MRSNLSTIAKVLVLALSLIVGVSDTGTSQMESRELSANAVSAKNLRGVYYDLPKEGPAAAVGRLAVLLLTAKGDSQEVNLHHRFRTGESFRFSVSSNQNGWLYILHRSPRGEPQLLWPRVNFSGTQGHLDYNRVEAGQATIIPASPGKFTFDDEVGNEYFYIVIRPTRRPPKLSAIPKAPTSGSGTTDIKASRLNDKKIPAAGYGKQNQNQQIGKKPSQKIVQFSVRGPKYPIRGVVYDPGPQDPDPHTYFTSHPKDESSDIVFEFKLLHE